MNACLSTSRPSKLYRSILPAIALGMVILLAVPRATVQLDDHWNLVNGVMLGTLFGQTTVIAIWTALGSAALRRRLEIATVWLGLLVASVLIGIVRGPNLGDGVAFLGLSLGSQWMLAQFLLWPLVWLYRLGLETECAEPGLGSKSQFGMWKLMSFTAAIAVLLGVGRLVVARQLVRNLPDGLPVFLFLAAAAMLVSLPPTLAMLLSKRALLSVLTFICLIDLLTVGELPVLNALGVLRGSDFADIAWINFFTCAWTLTFASIARGAGYRIQATSRRGSPRVLNEAATSAP